MIGNRHFGSAMSHARSRAVEIKSFGNRMGYAGIEVARLGDLELLGGDTQPG